MNIQDNYLKYKKNIFFSQNKDVQNHREKLIKTASIEMKIKNKNSIFIALHPGTVKSKLSKPFQKSNLKIQTPEESAAHLITIIKELKTSETGKFFNWDGTELPW